MNGAVVLLRIPPIRQKDGEWMGHWGWLREKMIRDGFIAGRNSHARVGLLLMNGAVVLLRIPPIRQKDGEWMGHWG
jgi:hypothetical protein